MFYYEYQEESSASIFPPSVILIGKSRFAKLFCPCRSVYTLQVLSAPAPGKRSFRQVEPLYPLCSPLGHRFSAYLGQSSPVRLTVTPQRPWQPPHLCVKN